MKSVDKATQTQLNNIQSKTGKSLEQLAAVVGKSGLTRHGEIRALLQKELGLGYGDANALAHHVLRSAGAHLAEGKSVDEVVAGFYAGAKAGIGPIHERLMNEIGKLGEFEIAPKKGYLSLRRKKQFAMIGPATNSRVEVGLNARALKKNPGLLEQPKGSMCNYVVRVSDLAEIDADLLSWIQAAFGSAG